MTMGVGQSVSIWCLLSHGTPPTASFDISHGIANATVSIQSLNSNGKTWTTVAIRTTGFSCPPTDTTGEFFVTMTPSAAGVYTYRVTCGGDSQYIPTISNIVTLTVTNVAIGSVPEPLHYPVPHPLRGPPLRPPPCRDGGSVAADTSHQRQPVMRTKRIALMICLSSARFLPTRGCGGRKGWR